MTPREAIRQRHAQELLRGEGDTLERAIEEFGLLSTAMGAMATDNGDQWRLSAMGAAKLLQKRMKGIERRLKRLNSDVRNEMRSGNVVRGDTVHT